MNKINKLIARLLVLAVLPIQSFAAGTLTAQGQFGGRLVIEEQEVNVTVNNGIAVTEVTQVFRNQEDRIVEALYRFPVPKKASVSDFSMWINGKEMIGEVLEKKRARQIYESYKAKRVDPGLLEQTDYKTFEMRIYPIPARGAQKIRLVYYQELDVDHDWATWVYPLNTTDEGYTSSRTTGKFALNFNIKSEIPITSLQSSSHSQDMAIAEHSKNYWQASLEVKEGDLNKDVVLAYQLQRPQTGFDLIFSKASKNEDGYFGMTLSVGKELSEQSTGMDYVFVLDISGSMNNGRKLGISNDSLNSFISELGEKDRFEVMSFNVAVNPLFNQLQAANLDNRSRAQSFLNKQRAKGGTDLRPAMNKAYSYNDDDRPLNVIVLSDGMTEQGSTRELLEIVRARPAGSRVFCIGVGNDVNRGLLEDVAERSGGLAAFLSRGDNFERQAKAFQRKLLRPAISDVKINFGSQIYDVEPETATNLYHGSPVRLYGRYKAAGDMPITLSGNLQGREFTKEIKIDFPAQDDSNPEIERMWAWHKIQRLQKQADRRGSRDDVIDEIVRLGEGYSIVSEYTSFLVLENDNEYKRWKIERKNALRIQRDRASQAKVKSELDRLRQRVDKNIGPADQPDQVTPPVQKPKTTPQTRSSSPAPQRNRSNNRSWNMGGGGALGFPAVLLALIAGFSVRKLKKD